MPSVQHIACTAALHGGRYPEHACTGPDHGQPVAALVRRGQRSLLIQPCGFNAIGIQRNILRGRPKGHHHRTDNQRLQRLFGVHQRHAQQARHDDELREQQPAAPPPQQAVEYGQRQAVHQRRPDPLEGIGQAHPAQKADGGAINISLAQPEAQGAQHQQGRQACREAQRQHAQAGGLYIDPEGLAPAALGRGFCIGGSAAGLGRLGHGQAR